MAEARDFFLTEKQLRDRFEDRVKEFVFGGYSPQVDPVLVLLGGQPAAGKSQAMAAAEQRHSDRQLVPLTGDELRSFHPDYQRLLDEEPWLFPQATGQASGAWVRMSIEYARDHGYSLILEGIFRDPAMTVATAEEFALTHRVEVVGLAVRAERSRLDSLHRYLDGGRWTPPHVHDLALPQMLETIAAVEGSPAVKRVTITDRTGADRYVNERTPQGAWGAEPAAVQAVHSVRARPLPPEEAAGWLERREDIVLSFAARGEVNDTTRPVLGQVTLDADVIASMVPAYSAARLRHEAVRQLLDVLGSEPLSHNGALPLLLIPDSELAARAAQLARPAAPTTSPATPPDLAQQLIGQGAPPEIIERARNSAREDREYARARESRTREQAGRRSHEAQRTVTEPERRSGLAPEATQAENSLRLRLQALLQAARPPVQAPPAPAPPPRIPGPEQHPPGRGLSR